MKAAPLVVNLVGAFAYAAWMFGAQGTGSPIPHPWVVGPVLQFLMMTLDFMALGQVLPHHVLMSVVQGVLLTNGLCDAGVSTDLTCKTAKQIPEYVLPIAITLYSYLIYNFKGMNLDVLAQLVGSLASLGAVGCSMKVIPVEGVCNIVARVKDPSVFLPRCMIFGCAMRALRALTASDDDDFDDDE